MAECSRRWVRVCTVALICALAGCERDEPVKVEVVVRRDFRGLVIFTPSQADGAVAVGSRLRVIVPPSGVVKLAGANPFYGSHSLIVHTEDGQSIPIDYKEVVADGDEAFRNVGPVPRDHGESTDSAYCIGTKSDALAAYRRIWGQGTSQPARSSERP